MNLEFGLDFETCIIFRASRSTQKNLPPPKKPANAVSSDCSFLNIYCFYLYGDDGSGILNAFEKKQKKHLSMM